MGGGANAIGGAGNATGGAACSAAIFTFEEDLPSSIPARSARTSFSSRTTRSRSHAASPRAANATRSVKKENTLALRRQAAAFLGATKRS